MLCVKEASNMTTSCSYALWTLKRRSEMTKLWHTLKKIGIDWREEG